MLDWLCVLALLLSLLLGAWRGLVYEVLALLNWVAAFWLAQWLAPSLAQRLPWVQLSDPLRYVAGFVLVFIAAVFIGGWLAALIKKMLAALGLQSADRALGAVFGLLRGVVLLLAATLLIGMTPLQSAPWWQNSWAAAKGQAMLRGLQPWLPQTLRPYVPASL